jgi:hypothetical protein
MPHLMWTDYMSRLVTQPYVHDSQPCIIVKPAAGLRAHLTV